jgi:hypothetical protein
VTVRLRQAQAARRLALVIELDHHGRLVSDHPRVVARLDDDHAGRDEVEGALVRVFAADMAAREKAHVGVHAVRRADDRLHVLGPTEARRVDRPFHPAVSGPGDVELDAARLLVVRARDRSK